MSRPTSRACIALTLTLLAHPASGAEPAAPDSASPPALADAGLQNTAWQLLGYRSGAGFVRIPGDARPAHFRFEDGRLSGDTGCNQLSGTYQANGEGIAFDAEMAVTRRGCANPLMEQESAILAALARVVSYRIEGDRLLMLDAEGKALLQFHAASHSPLVGYLWQLEDYDDGSGTLIAPLKGTRIDLTFLGTGVLGGSDGCNRYMSGYRSEETRLRIGPIATTRAACPDTGGRAGQASAYAAVLGKVAGFGIEGRRLTLVSSEGRPLANYRALEAPPSNDR